MNDPGFPAADLPLARLTIAGHSFRSRLMLGTRKYRDAGKPPLGGRRLGFFSIAEDRVGGLASDGLLTTGRQSAATPPLLVSISNPAAK
jgi:hypothetical protein